MVKKYDHSKKRKIRKTNLITKRTLGFLIKTIIQIQNLVLVAHFEEQKVLNRLL